MSLGMLSLTRLPDPALSLFSVFNLCTFFICSVQYYVVAVLGYRVYTFPAIVVVVVGIGVAVSGDDGDGGGDGGGAGGGGDDVADVDVVVIAIVGGFAFAGAGAQKLFRHTARWRCSGLFWHGSHSIMANGFLVNEFKSVQIYIWSESEARFHKTSTFYILLPLLSTQLFRQRFVRFTNVCNYLLLLFSVFFPPYLFCLWIALLVLFIS